MPFKSCLPPSPVSTCSSLSLLIIINFSFCFGLVAWFVCFPQSSWGFAALLPEMFSPVNFSLSWKGAPLAVQVLSNLPAMLETQVQSLDQEDPLQKGMATHSSIPWGCKELDMTDTLTLTLSWKDLWMGQSSPPLGSLLCLSPLSVLVESGSPLCCRYARGISLPLNSPQAGISESLCLLPPTRHQGPPQSVLPLLPSQPLMWCWEALGQNWTCQQSAHRLPWWACFCNALCPALYPQGDPFLMSVAQIWRPLTF